MTTYTASDSATMITAASSAVAGDKIDVTSNITAAAEDTVLTLATGVEFDGNGFTIAGFVYLWDGGTSGEYTATLIHDVVFDITNCTDGARLGTINLYRGNYSLTDVTITGDNSGGSSTGKSLNILDSSTVRCEATLTRVTVSGSAADCVSCGCISGTSQPTSFLKAYDCAFSDPGPAAADNCFTSHANFPAYMYDGTLTTAGGGPMVNSSPVNSTMELYRVAITVSGTTDIVCTKIVGCTITGTSSGKVILHGDSLKSSEASIAAFNTLSIGMNLFSTDLGVAPTIYGNTFTVDDKGIEYSAASNLTSVAARNTFNGPKTANNYAMRPRGNGTTSFFNNTINIPVGPAANVYPVFPDSPTSGTNTVEVRRCLINSAGRTINYASRGDATNCQVLLYETITTCGTAIFFDGSSPNSSATNCTTDGTNPNAYEVGSAYICDELKLLDAYGLEGWDQSASPVDAIALYYGLLPPTMTSVAADSATQCTVSYTNKNAGAKDHRIERATDAGFTADVTTFDVSSVASGAATYVDATCDPATQYYYRVYAKNTTALSIPSSSDDDTTPAPSGYKNTLLLGVG